MGGREGGVDLLASQHSLTANMLNRQRDCVCVCVSYGGEAALWVLVEAVEEAAAAEATAAEEDEAWRLLSGERERERERERDLDLLLRRRTHTWRVRVCVCD